MMGMEIKVCDNVNEKKGETHRENKNEANLDNKEIKVSENVNETNGEAHAENNTSVETGDRNITTKEPANGETNIKNKTVTGSDNGRTTENDNVSREAYIENKTATNSNNRDSAEENAVGKNVVMENDTATKSDDDKMTYKNEPCNTEVGLNSLNKETKSPVTCKVKDNDEINDKSNIVSDQKCTLQENGEQKIQTPIDKNDDTVKVGDNDNAETHNSPKDPVSSTECPYNNQEKHDTLDQPADVSQSKVHEKHDCENVDKDVMKHCDKAPAETFSKIKEQASSTQLTTCVRNMDHLKVPAQTLKRSSTAPNLFGSKVHSTKTLIKRNTVPSNLTDTLLMVGRMHDVEEKTLEKIKRFSLDDPESNVGDENRTELNMINSTSGTHNTKNDVTQPNFPTEDIVSVLQSVQNTNTPDTDDKPVQVHVIPVKPQSQVTNAQALLSTEPERHKVELATHELERLNQRRSSRVSICLNDTPLDDDIASTSKFVPLQSSFESDVTTEDLSDRLFQPCLINISSCSTATMEGGLSPENNLDQNLLRVNDSDNTSLNHYKTVKRNKVAPSQSSGSTTKEANISRQDSGICHGQPSVDDNLEEARTRMHSLLDQAFSLISPRTSMTETDIRNKRSGNNQMTSQNTTSNRGREETGASSKLNKPQESNRGKDVRHEPMFVNPAFTDSYSDFPLETWSPYRASDQVALISMPHRLEPEPMKLGHKPDKRPASSKPNKRPAASFDFNESKSTSAIDDSKYTRNAPKPIVLRTKDLPNNKADSAKSNGTKSNRKYSATGIGGDVYLTGSTTSLSDPKAKNRTDNIEMSTYQNGSTKSHRAPRKDLRNSDEVDVINTLNPPDTTDNLISSLRAELHGLKESFKPPEAKPGKRRKSNARPMTEIV